MLASLTLSASLISCPSSSTSPRRIFNASQDLTKLKVKSISSDAAHLGIPAIGQFQHHFLKRPGNP
jgi:hypothetical protein